MNICAQRAFLGTLSKPSKLNGMDKDINKYLDVHRTHRWARGKEDILDRAPKPRGKTVAEIQLLKNFPQILECNNSMKMRAFPKSYFEVLFLA